MYVIKRNGSRQEVDFNQISARIRELAGGLDTRYVDVEAITKRTIEGLYDGIRTSELDAAAAYICASMSTRHPDFSKLAARITVSDLHKNTPDSFLKYVKKAYTHTSTKTGEHTPLVSLEVLQVATQHQKHIEEAVNHQRDYDNFDYFGIKTLEKGYLVRDDRGTILERPQHMYMRVAIGIQGNDIESILETHENLSTKKYTHGSPTMFNAGTMMSQMASCFLLTMAGDSIDGIYRTLKQCAHISARGGGLSVAVSNIRSEGTFIKRSRGQSDGVVPMLRVFNETARYVNQGGKRKGAFAVYLEPWHADVEGFLDLKINHGAEELRARDLFYALWIPDLFMKRVERDGKWSLFSPNEAPGLMDSWGEEFETLYERYEKEGRARKTLHARELWNRIVRSQIETGVPYMLYKDAANKKSNQKNLGVIHSSNLCTEIMQYSAPGEIAVCNIASIAVNECVRKDGSYDFKELHRVTRLVTRNLNKVIDHTYYPLKEARRSNMRHRPIGIGVQGLADAFVLMGYVFGDENSRRLNKDIFETIYHGAVTESVALAKKDGAYETFNGSPASKGLFQFDMWGIVPDSGHWKWFQLREDIQKHGLRNSLLIAPMPTATTAQILGNNEAFEPFNSNMYVRRVLSGEFVVLNKHLVKDLIDLDLWNEDIRRRLIAHQGSVQHIDEIPSFIKERYRTVWEIPQKTVIDMAADRAPYIDQSQSMNIHMTDATPDKVTSMHFYAWKKGLKTGMYYLRNTPACYAVQFTVDNTERHKKKEGYGEKKIGQSVEKAIPVNTTSDDDTGVCISCDG